MQLSILTLRVDYEMLGTALDCNRLNMDMRVT